MSTCEIMYADWNETIRQHCELRVNAPAAAEEGKSGFLLITNCIGWCQGMSVDAWCLTGMANS